MDDMTVKEYAKSRNISEESVRIKLRTNLLDGKIKTDVDENSNRKTTFLTPEAIALLDCMFYRTIKRNKDKKDTEKSQKEIKDLKEKLNSLEEKILTLEKIKEEQKNLIRQMEENDKSREENIILKNQIIKIISDELKEAVKEDYTIEQIKNRVNAVIRKLNEIQKIIDHQ